MKQVLPTRVKRFVVQLNAMGDSPSEVVRAVAQEFSLEITPQLVQRYDPTKIPGRTLSAGLKELFYATRKAFVESADDLPIAQKAVRLRLLAQVIERNEGKADKIVTTAIEAARREMMALQLGEGSGEFAGVFRVFNSPDDDAPAPLPVEEKAVSTVSTEQPPASP